MITSAIIGYYPNARFDLELTIPYVYQGSGAAVSAGNIRYGAIPTQ